MQPVAHAPGVRTGACEPRAPVELREVGADGGGDDGDGARRGHGAASMPGGADGPRRGWSR